MADVTEGRRSTEESPIIAQDRGMMKVYVAREYVDETYRTNNLVQVNIPEYTPTIPQDDKHTNITMESDFFVNENYPKTQGTVKAVHSICLPILKGTFAPVRMKKGAEFLLYYPTGKIEEGFLIYIRDKELDGEDICDGNHPNT